MPSASRISLTAAETSASSRAISRGAHLDDGDLAAEAAVHLRELEPDIAAADDDQMPRQRRRDRSSTCWSDTAPRRCPACPARSARPPTLMKICSARRAARRRRATSCGRSKRAWPSIDGAAVHRRQPALDAARASRATIASLRALTRAMSTLDRAVDRRRRSRRRGARDGRHRRWRPASWSACSRC